MYAARNGNIDVAIELLKHGADINATNKEGKSALTIAWQKGHVEIEGLLQDPDSAREQAWQYQNPTRKNKRSLKIRSESEIAQSVKRKLAEMSEGVPKKIRQPIIKEDSENALIARKKLAERDIPFSRDEFVKRAGEKDISAVRWFLAAGMNPNARRKDAREETAAAAAANSGSLEIVKLLLDHGADPNLSLRPWPWETMPLLFAVRGGHLEIVRLLLENGVKIDTKDSWGVTPLMAAAQNGDREILELLLAKNPDVNLRMDGKWADGSTALMIAAERGDIEIVRALLDRGADANVSGNDKKTALMRAAGKGDAEIVRILLDKGANAHVMDWYGMTPLLVAAKGRHTEIVTTLLDKGADVNARNEENQTDFMVAVKQGLIECAELFANYGADVNARDYDGETALMHAASNGDTEMVEFLIENDADANAEDNSGTTALSRASFKGHAEIVELLEQADAVEAEIQTAEQTGPKLLGPAARVDFRPNAANWDDDPAADGAEISIDLRGKRGKPIDFEGIELSVEIRIYASTERKNRDEFDGRLIYDGTHTISSPMDRIKIPNDDLKDLEPGEDYWAIDAFVTLPDGRTIEQKTISESWIMPEGAVIKPPVE
jgi:ankyrin repeat protein